MKQMQKAIYWVNEKLGLLCGILAIALALVIAVDIFWRRVLLNPITEPAELNTYLLVACAVLCGGYVLQVGGHVKVDILYSKFSERVKAIVDLITSVFALAYLIWLDWLVCEFAWLSFVSKETSSQAFWPLFPSKVLLPIGVTLFIITLILQMAQKWSYLRKGKVLTKIEEETQAGESDQTW